MSKEVVNGVRVWAREIDEKTLEQAERQARSDVVSGPIALMADAHVGLTRDRPARRLPRADRVRVVALLRD